MRKSMLVVVPMLFAFGVWPPAAFSEDDSPAEVFNQRILPIFKSPKPSSCVQCHLAAVDLKNYILPSHEKTFLSLRDQGLIDLDSPEKSKILTLIEMGEKDADKGARLIHEKMRQAEFEAFAAWIKASAEDPKLRSLPPLDPEELAGPEKPNEVIRHARKSRLVDSFARNVFSQRMRCFPCHTPNEVDPANPQHQAAVKTRNKMLEDYGEEVFARLNFFQTTPEETLKKIIAASQNTPEGQLPIINIESPEKSLLVLKPMSKLPEKIAEGKFAPPSSAEPVTHMGGLKMHKDDQSYKSFVAWLKDYANVVGGRYASPDELPADNWHATELVLRLASVPEGWAEGVPVQLFLHAWNEETNGWEEEPAAFTQGTVTPRRIVNGALFLLGSKSSKNVKPPEFRPGRYLVKVYADSKGRLTDDPALLLGVEEFRGQAVLDAGRWREGFRQAKTISGDVLKP